MGIGRGSGPKWAGLRADALRKVRPAQRGGAQAAAAITTWQPLARAGVYACPAAISAVCLRIQRHSQL